MNSVDGPIILRNDDGSFGSMFQIVDSSLTDKLLDVNTGYFAALKPTDTITGSNGISIGVGSLIAAADNSIALGSSSVADFDNAIGIGNGAEANSISSIAIGTGAVIVDSSSSNNIAIGTSSSAGTGGNAIAIGSNSNASADNTISIGQLSSASGTNAIALGDNTGVTGIYGIAIGSSSLITGDNSAIISPTSATITNEATNSIILSTLDSALTLTANTLNNSTLTTVFSSGQRWVSNVSAGELDYTRANRLTWGANETKTTSGNVTNDQFTSTLDLPDCYSVLIKAQLIGTLTDCDVSKTWSYTYYTNATNAGSPPTISINPFTSIIATENIPSLNNANPLVFTPTTDAIEFGITTTGLNDSPADVIQWILILEVAYNKFF